MTPEQEQLIKDFKGTFGTQEGERVLKALSKFCLEHQQTYVEESDRKSAFNEGARSVILYIRSKVEADLGKEQQTDAIS